MASRSQTIIAVAILTWIRMLCGCSAEFLTTLGRYPLRGVDEPLEVFGLSEER